DLLPDGVQGAERGHRLLRDEGDVAATYAAHLPTLRRQFGEVGLEGPALPALVAAVLMRTAVNDLAGDDPAGSLHQAEYRLHRDALTAAALPRDPDDLACVEVEADAVDRLGDPLVELE